MPQSEMQRRVRAERDIRRRIDALTGKVQKPAEVMVRSSIQPLLDKLGRQWRTTAASARIADQYTRQLGRINQRDVRISRDERAAANAYRAALVKRGRSIATRPPRMSAVPPQVRSGSILTVDSAPYSARWTHGTGGSASFLQGTWSTACGGNNHSYAGVCTFFSPLPGVFPVRFAPYMPLNYSYMINTYSSPWMPWGFSRAGASGFVGVFVSGSRDGGSTWEEVRDNRLPVFGNSVSVNDSASDSVEADVFAIQTEFLTFDKPVLFALWGWGGVDTSERDGPGLDFGFAQASMSASIPFLVIEQKI